MNDLRAWPEHPGHGIDPGAQGRVHQMRIVQGRLLLAVAQIPDSLGGKRMAIRVAELARAGLTPDWMPSAVYPWTSSETGMGTAPLAS
jgi:hypothetical protein